MERQPQQDEVVFFNKPPPLSAKIYISGFPSPISRDTLYQHLIETYGPVFYLATSDENHNLIRHNEKRAKEEEEAQALEAAETQSFDVGPGYSATMLSTQATVAASSRRNRKKEIHRYALAHFYSVLDAQVAMADLNGLRIGNKKLHSRPSNSEYTGNRNESLSHFSCMKIANLWIGFQNWSSSIVSYKRFPMPLTMASKEVQLLVADEKRAHDRTTNVKQRNNTIRKGKTEKNTDTSAGPEAAAPQGLMIMCHEAHVRVHMRLDGVMSDGVEKVYSPMISSDGDSPAMRNKGERRKDSNWLDQPSVTQLQTAAKVAVTNATVRAFENIALIRLGRGGDVICVKMKQTSTTNSDSDDSEDENNPQQSVGGFGTSEQI